MEMTVPLTVVARYYSEIHMTKAWRAATQPEFRRLIVISRDFSGLSVTKLVRLRNIRLSTIGARLDRTLLSYSLHLTTSRRTDGSDSVGF